jgi:hypothetical protein
VRETARGTVELIRRDRGNRAALLGGQSFTRTDCGRIGEERRAERALGVEPRQEALDVTLHQSMIPKSGYRFSDKIMLHQ